MPAAAPTPRIAITPVVALLISVYGPTALAQVAATALPPAAPAAAASPAPSAASLAPVTVQADPLDRVDLDLLRPASVLRGEALRAAEGSNLGDTVARQPGVQSSAYGAGAGRPIIRGMDSSRVRITESGLGVADVSGASPDHRVAADTLNARQVEVLRGPATLLYGSGAIGGLVNIVSERVPMQRVQDVGASLALRGATAERERAAALDLDVPLGVDVAGRIEGFKQRTGDYRLAAPLRDAQGDVIARGRLPNSDTDTQSLSAGAAWFGERGLRLGGAVQRYESDYGIPNPDEPVTIRLRRSRVELQGDLGQSVQPLAGLRLRVGLTDYAHREVAPDGSTGARFTNRGGEGRAELPQAWGDWRGVVGLQWQQMRTEGSGEGELPRTQADSAALFVVQERRFGGWRAELGARAEAERYDVRSRYADGGQAPSRRFALGTLSAGLGRDLGGGWDLAAALTSAQRAPAVEELYFVGAHPATFAYEVGNPQLRKERALNLDTTLKYTRGAWRAEATLFSNRVRDYVFGFFDGSTTDVLDENGNVEETLSTLRFSQADARLRGGELSIAYGAARGAHARLWGDTVRATLVSGDASGSPLPRISPSRIGFDLGWRAAHWSAQAMLTRVAAQNRVARFDLRDGEPEQPTAGYTRIDALVAWRPADLPVTLTLQGRNLTNEDIRVHTSFLKALAPPPGRSIVLGLRATL